MQRVGSRNVCARDSTDRLWVLAVVAWVGRAAGAERGAPGVRRAIRVLGLHVWEVCVGRSGGFSIAKVAGVGRTSCTTDVFVCEG